MNDDESLFERLQWLFLCGQRAVAPDRIFPEDPWDHYRCEKFLIHRGHHHGWGKRKPWRLFCWHTSGKDVLRCDGF